MVQSYIHSKVQFPPNEFEAAEAISIVIQEFVARRCNVPVQPQIEPNDPMDIEPTPQVIHPEMPQSSTSEQEVFEEQPSSQANQLELELNRYQKHGEGLFAYEAGGDGNCGPYCIEKQLKLFGINNLGHVSVRDKVAELQQQQSIQGEFWVDEDWKVAQLLDVVVVVFQLPRRLSLSIRIFGNQNEIHSKRVIFILNTQWTAIHPVEHYQIMYEQLNKTQCEQFQLQLEDSRTIGERVTEHELLKGAPFLSGEHVWFQCRDTPYTVGKIVTVLPSAESCMIEIIAYRDIKIEVS
jgi:hypothetical protein